MLKIYIESQSGQYYKHQKQKNLNKQTNKKPLTYVPEKPFSLSESQFSHWEMKTIGFISSQCCFPKVL